MVISEHFPTKIFSHSEPPLRCSVKYSDSRSHTAILTPASRLYVVPDFLSEVGPLLLLPCLECIRKVKSEQFREQQVTLSLHV